MKLNTAQIERIQDQVGLSPVPETEPVQEQLEQHFGPHTFYVDPAGLYVFETVDDSELAAPQAEALRVASWANEDRTLLQSHHPRPTGAVVTFGAIH